MDRVWGIVGEADQVIAVNKPTGAHIEATESRPSVCHVLQADGTWADDGSIALRDIKRRQSEVLAPTDYLYRRDRTSTVAMDEWCVSVRQVNNDYEASVLDYAAAMAWLDDLAAACPV